MTWILGIFGALAFIAVVGVAYNIGRSRPKSVLSKDDKFAAQYMLGTSVVRWSGIGVLLLTMLIAAAMMMAAFLHPKGGASDDPSLLEELSEQLLRLLTTILPVVGTWVGTVLAFYFSGENFRAASEANNALVARLGENRPTPIKVTDVMTPWNSIAEKQELSESKSKTIDELLAILNNTVSRLVVYKVQDKDSEDAQITVSHVIHDSTLFKFKVKVADEPTTLATLDGLLGDEQFNSIAAQIAFVGPQADLRDAKAKMADITRPNCRNVFVTSDGTKFGKPLGWITDRDIAMKLNS